MIRDLTRTGKALGDPQRVRALAALRGGELCLCRLIALLRLAPSTVSKHMSLLIQAGLVFDNAVTITRDTRIQALTPENLRLILTEEYWRGNAALGLYRPSFSIPPRWNSRNTPHLSPLW